MFKNYRQLLARVLLACLTLQPFTAAAAFSWQPPTQQPPATPELILPADFQASQTLQSPWKKDFAALELLSQFPLHTNKEFLELLRNKMPVSVEALDKQYTAKEIKEKRSWVRLFNNLQFVNEEGKKTAMIGLGRTITEAGRISFLNIIAQENTDVGVAKKRQEFIKYLVENPNQLKQIQDQLHIIKKFENEPLERLFVKNPLDAFPPDARKNIELQRKILMVYACIYFYALITTGTAALGKKGQNRSSPGQGLIETLWLTNNAQAPNWQTLKANFGSILGSGAEKAYKFQPTPLKMITIQHALMLTIYLLWKKFNDVEIIGNVIGGGSKYIYTILASALGALTALTPISPKTSVTAARTIVEYGIIHPTAFLVETLGKIALFLWNRRTPTGYQLNSALSGQLSVIFNTLGNGYETAGNNNVLGGKVPVKLIITSILGAVSFAAYLGFKHLYYTNKGNFKQANGIANIVGSSKQLHDILKTIPLAEVSSGYTELMGSISDLYKKIQHRSATSYKYGPTAEYTPLNFYIHNTARDNYILQNVGSTFEDFSKITQFYGEIDAYASLAQLIIDHQTIKSSHGEDIRCCFAEFVNNPVESMLVTEDMWHPIIPTTHVRTNSIALGDSVDHPRNGIITGPNAAGKSVSMKALLINIVLGQSFGIACAKSFKFTPFKKIIARLSSNDDTANDQSKFMLEAADVVAFLKELKSLKPGEKAFVVTDELFSGTEVNPAILLSFELCARVSKFHNVCYLLATHYKDLTQLKEITDQQFENFKVSAFVVDNKVQYPFKLTKGVGDVNVAFDIFLDQMEKQGVKDEDLESIISNARKRQHLLEHNTDAIIA